MSVYQVADSTDRRHHLLYESKKPSVAIVGAGFAGTWLEIYILDKADRDFVIYEIESHDVRKNGGIAYGECGPDHQVNLSPERQFGPADDDQDYINWLNSADRGLWPEPFRSHIADSVVGAGSGEYPRGLFRMYSAERLQQAKDRAAARGINIEYVQVMAEASSIEETPDGRTTINLSSMINTCGNPLHVMMEDNGNDNKVVTDIWIIATGHGPPMVPPFMRNIQESDRVAIDPWCPKVAKRMSERDQSESIFYVGTGMTTYDLIMMDETRGHTGPAVMASRHADLHHVYQEGQTFPAVDVETPEAFFKARTKDELLYGKDSEFEGAVSIFVRVTSPKESGGEGLTSEQVLLNWQKFIPELIKNLPDHDLRELFKEKTPLNTRNIGIAPKVGAALDRAFARGLEMWATNIHDMEERPDGIYVDLTRTDVTPAQRQVLHFDRVYSGLGMANDFNYIKQVSPLWFDIIETNSFTEPHRFGGVKVETGGRFPWAKHGFTVGMPMTGTRIERGFGPTIAGAVVSIRTDFEEISNEVLGQLKEI